MNSLINSYLLKQKKDTDKEVKNNLIFTYIPDNSDKHLNTMYISLIKIERIIIQDIVIQDPLDPLPGPIMIPPMLNVGEYFINKSEDRFYLYLVEKLGRARIANIGYYSLEYNEEICLFFCDATELIIANNLKNCIYHDNNYFRMINTNSNGKISYALPNLVYLIHNESIEVFGARAIRVYEDHFVNDFNNHFIDVLDEGIIDPNLDNYFTDKIYYTKGITPNIQVKSRMDFLTNSNIKLGDTFYCKDIMMIRKQYDGKYWNSIQYKI